MAKIAFLGLGQMGTPMAARLVQAGHQVSVWDRTARQAAPLVERGALTGATPAEVGKGAEFVITMLTNAEAVGEVVFGVDGVIRALGTGQIWIDMSTIGPSAYRCLAARVPAGVAAVDAPVRGSVPQATEGRLDIFLGADDPIGEQVLPLLAALGTVHRVGGPGSGAAMKVVVNNTLGASIVALGECLALSRALGLDRAVVLDILAASPIGPAVAAKRGNVEADRYPPSFKLRHAAKDMGLVAEAATAAGLDLKQARAGLAWFTEAAGQGASDLDYSAVVATILGEAHPEG